MNKYKVTLSEYYAELLNGDLDINTKIIESELEIDQLLDQIRIEVATALRITEQKQLIRLYNDITIQVL